jgi:hypothetical protein
MVENLDEALAVAMDVLRRPPDDSEHPWHLREFGSGWLIEESDFGGPVLVGGPRRVIERNSGRIMRFPSSVPPRRILNEYESIASRGKTES